MGMARPFTFNRDGTGALSIRMMSSCWAMTRFAIAGSRTVFETVKAIPFASN
jgi:hypothetical protein